MTPFLNEEWGETDLDYYLTFLGFLPVYIYQLEFL